MLFPNLLSANLTVKAIMYTADCRFGGVLRGTAAPVVFMSRADSTETRLNSLALTLRILDHGQGLVGSVPPVSNDPPADRSPPSRTSRSDDRCARASRLRVVLAGRIDRPADRRRGSTDRPAPGSAGARAAAGSPRTHPRERCSTATCSTRRGGTSTRGARRSPPSRRPRTSRGDRETLRAFFLRSLGDLPERTPLNPRVVGTLPRDGYRVEKVIFESRPGHHVTANLYLPDGKPPFPGVLVPCGHSDNGKADERLSARLHPAGEERHGRALLRPDRPGRAVSAARRAGQAGDPRHDRAHDGRHRGAPGRPAAGQLPDLGRHPRPRLPGQPARGRSRPARLHRQLGRRHDDGLPDGARRPDRRGGAVVLHHVARAALRHDRPAGRRAEHHRPGRRRHGARRLRDHARAEADLAHGRHPRLLRHPGELGHVPRGQADLRPARLTASGSTCSSRTRSTASPDPGASPRPAG